MKKVLLVMSMLWLGTPQSSVSQVTGSVVVSSVADFTGDGAVHTLAATGTTARWVQIICPSTNTAAVRIGDSAITTSRGAAVAAGGGLMMPPIPSAPRTNNPDQYYDLGRISYLAQSGDKVTLIYAK